MSPNNFKQPLTALSAAALWVCFAGEMAGAQNTGRVSRAAPVPSQGPKTKKVVVVLEGHSDHLRSCDDRPESQTGSGVRILVCPLPTKSPQLNRSAPSAGPFTARHTRRVIFLKQES